VDARRYRRPARPAAAHAARHSVHPAAAHAVHLLEHALRDLELELRASRRDDTERPTK